LEALAAAGVVGKDEAVAESGEVAVKGSKVEHRRSTGGDAEESSRGVAGKAAIEIDARRSAGSEI
jgi:hypothetical protein